MSVRLDCEGLLLVLITVVATIGPVTAAAAAATPPSTEATSAAAKATAAPLTVLEPTLAIAAVTHRCDGRVEVGRECCDARVGNSRALIAQRHTCMHNTICRLGYELPL